VFRNDQQNTEQGLCVYKWAHSCAQMVRKLTFKRRTWSLHQISYHRPWAPKTETLGLSTACWWSTSDKHLLITRKGCPYVNQFPGSGVWPKSTICPDVALRKGMCAASIVMGPDLMLVVMKHLPLQCLASVYQWSQLLH
jgi:hypothetical protein